MKNKDLLLNFLQIGFKNRNDLYSGPALNLAFENYFVISALNSDIKRGRKSSTMFFGHQEMKKITKLKKLQELKLIVILGSIYQVFILLVYSKALSFIFLRKR